MRQARMRRRIKRPEEVPEVPVARPEEPEPPPAQDQTADALPDDIRRMIEAAYT